MFPQHPADESALTARLREFSFEWAFTPVPSCVWTPPSPRPPHCAAVPPSNFAKPKTFSSGYFRATNVAINVVNCSSATYRPAKNRSTTPPPPPPPRWAVSSANSPPPPPPTHPPTPFSSPPHPKSLPTLKPTSEADGRRRRLAHLPGLIYLQAVFFKDR